MRLRDLFLRVVTGYAFEYLTIYRYRSKDYNFIFLIYIKNEDYNDDFDWLRNQFATPSGSVNTGPSFDNTLGPGKAGQTYLI